MDEAWQTVRATRHPPAIVARLDEGLGRLTKAVKAHDASAAEQAAIDVSQPILDLELRYRRPVDIDVARFHLWTQQLRVHAAAKDLAGLTGDVAVLEWIRDRIPAAVDRVGQREVDARLHDLRAAADARNLPAAADHAARLGARVRTLAG
jgi:hypothetical protein